jgi:signal transduction histidine kinase
MSDSTPIGPEKPAEPDPYLVLGHLSSTVVHKVVNDFSTIVSQAEILKAMAVAAGVDPSEAERRADVIIKAALDGSTRARGLSEFSRKATAVPADGDLVDLNGLVRERLDAQRRRPGSNARWVENLAAPARLRGSASHLRIMLDGLLENAREALAAGGGVVTASTSVDPMGWLVLEIRDDGPGMAPEVLERALEPFFSTKPGREGLGLALARGIWRRHRGAFAIETAPGAGTLVRLSCPPPRDAGPGASGAK